MYDADDWLVRARDLGALLAEREERHTLLIVGGFAMQVQGLGTRTMTRDLDAWGRLVDGVLESASPLPETLVSAVAAIARVHDVDAKWLNTQVAAELLDKPWPDGIVDRARPIELGGLTLLVVDRIDLVHLKLAAASRSGNFSPRRVDEKHRADLRALAPTPAELADAVEWIRHAWGDAHAEVAVELVEEDH